MEIAIVIGLILLNGIFSMSEIALISARKTSLNNEAYRGSKAAQRALKLAGNPDRFLSTVQVGITLIGILTGIYSGDVLAGKFSPILEQWGVSVRYAYPIAQITIVILVTYLTIIFGELVPKRIGMTAAERVSKLIAGPMQGLSVVATPFVWLLSKSTTLIFNLLGMKDKESKVTEEEIKLMIREGTEDGEVQVVEQDIMERVFTLGDRDLASIMTHRSEIVWMDAEMTIDQIKAIIQNNPFSKYPVCQQELDHVEGIVYLKDIFLKIDKPGFDIRACVRPARHFYENMEVYAALEQMKTNQIQTALVSDEFGTISGLVTLKDIMEALVGELPEPHEEPEIVPREDGSFLVDGQCSFYNFLSFFKLSDLYVDYEFNTLSGLILEELGNIPKTGEKLQWQSFTFEIMDMDGARIDKVLVTRNL